MRQARLKKNRGVYKCQRFGTLHYLEIIAKKIAQKNGANQILSLSVPSSQLDRPGTAAALPLRKAEAVAAGLHALNTLWNNNIICLMI